MQTKAVQKNVEALTARIVLLLLSGLYFYAAIVHSVHTYFWMDEVLAVSTAQLGGFGQIWSAIWQGAEFSPPTYDFLLHCLTWLPRGLPDILLFRLPSILAVYGAALCVRALLKPHVSPLLAVLGFGMVLDSGLFAFAVQARPYAILALGLALALVLWANIGRGRNDKMLGTALWLVLAGCVSLHFYGILTLGVLCVAEFGWWVDRRQIRSVVWFALILVLPVVLAWCPLEVHLGQMNAADIYASGYHGEPTLSRFELGFYETVLNDQMTVHLAVWMIFTTAVFCALDILFGRGTAGIWKHQIVSRQANLPLYCIIIALATLPLGAYLFSLCLTGTLTGRYMSAAALLPGLIAAYLLKNFRRQDMIVLFTVPLIAHHIFLLSIAHDPLRPVMEILAQPRQQLPVAVPEGLLYIELMYAVPPRERSQFVFLRTPPDVVSIDPTNEHQAIRLAPLQSDYSIESMQNFITHNRFFYTIIDKNGPPESVTPSLYQMGLLGHVVVQEGSISLYKAGSAGGMDGAFVKPIAFSGTKKTAEPSPAASSHP